MRLWSLKLYWVDVMACGSYNFQINELTVIYPRLTKQYIWLTWKDSLSEAPIDLEQNPEG